MGQLLLSQLIYFSKFISILMCYSNYCNLLQISSNSSDDTGSTSSNLRRRRGIRMGTSASLSDPDVSSSEQSVDTVIFVPGKHNRHIHRSPAGYRTSTLQRQSSAPAPIQPINTDEMVNVRASPYNITGMLYVLSLFISTFV